MSNVKDFTKSSIYKERRKYTNVIANYFKDNSIFEKQRQNTITYDTAKKMVLDFILNNHGVEHYSIIVFVYRVVFKKNEMSAVLFLENEGYSYDYITKIIKEIYNENHSFNKQS